MGTIMKQSIKQSKIWSKRRDHSIYMTAWVKVQDGTRHLVYSLILLGSRKEPFEQIHVLWMYKLTGAPWSNFSESLTAVTLVSKLVMTVGVLL